MDIVSSEADCHSSFVYYSILYIINGYDNLLNIMDHPTDIEQAILDHALQAVARETGLHLRQDARQPRGGDTRQADAFVRLEHHDQLLAAEIRKWAQHIHLGALIHQVRQLPEPGLLVADYINPNMADKLRQQGVQFIDTAGNAFINQPPVYVYVTGRRAEAQHLPHGREGMNRAFEPKGLQVVYAFLRNPALVTAPYRDIAARADVAVGTVGWVINGLKAANFIRDKGGRRGRRLAHYRKLLDRWVEAWPEKLRPKHFMGEYVTDTADWWKTVDIQLYGGCWGGEIAAAQYTAYLTPQEAMVYLPEPERPRLLRDACLRKATQRRGEAATTVRLYRPFWPEQPDKADTELPPGLAHPILVYADLVATGDPRNLEAAGRLFDQYIAQYCGEG